MKANARNPAIGLITIIESDRPWMAQIKITPRIETAQPRGAVLSDSLAVLAMNSGFGTANA